MRGWPYLSNEPSKSIPLLASADSIMDAISLKVESRDMELLHRGFIDRLFELSLQIVAEFILSTTGREIYPSGRNPQ